MSRDNLSVVLRILDNENRLLERADQKAMAQLSILGVFMVFFIAYYRVIPVNPFTVAFLCIYFFCALYAMTSLLMSVRPRIQKSKPGETGNDETTCEPAFFAGICQFSNLGDYQRALENVLQNENAVLNIYIRQVFSVARINAVKYKYLQRATIFTIVALVVELIIIAYLFANYLGEGAIPPIF